MGLRKHASEQVPEPAMRQFLEPPPEAAGCFTRRSLTQYDCHECGLEVRDWQLATHWGWHLRIQPELATQAE